MPYRSSAVIPVKINPHNTKFNRVGCFLGFHRFLLVDSHFDSELADYAFLNASIGCAVCGKPFKKEGKKIIDDDSLPFLFSYWFELWVQYQAATGMLPRIVAVSEIMDRESPHSFPENRTAVWGKIWAKPLAE